RPDRLVRVLRVLLRFVAVRLVGERGWGVGRGDVVAGAFERLLGDARRVGAHVGDQADRAAVADLAPFIDALRERHRALDREAEAARRLLLQAAGDERRAGLLLRLLALDALDDEAPLLEVADDAARLLAVADDRLLAVDAREARGERRRQVGRELGAQVPVLLGDERVDLVLPLADHLERDRLHARS